MKKFSDDVVTDGSAISLQEYMSCLLAPPSLCSAVLPDSPTRCRATDWDGGARCFNVGGRMGFNRGTPKIREGLDRTDGKVGGS